MAESETLGENSHDGTRRRVIMTHRVIAVASTARMRMDHTHHSRTFLAAGGVHTLPGGDIRAHVTPRRLDDT